MTPDASLRVIKFFHTIVWVFFAGCIIAIPILAFMRRYDQAVVLVGVVLIESRAAQQTDLRTTILGRSTVDPWPMGWLAWLRSEETEECLAASLCRRRPFKALKN